MEKELENIKKKLCMVQYAKKELKLLENELRELEAESYIMGQQLTGMPTDTKRTDKVANRAIRKKRLEDKINNSINRIYEKREEVEGILDLLEDDEQRLSLRLHCINGMSWMFVAAEMNLSERTARRRYKEGLIELNKKMSKK